MTHTQVLLVFPGSLYGGPWAAGHPVKPELVSLFGEVRRGGFSVDVLDLDVELGSPADDEARDEFLRRVGALLAERSADLAVISCPSAPQYSAALAVGRMYRRLHLEAGAVGHALYLEAEASGLRGTAMGCFLDEETHALLGLEGRAFQVLYHFAVGRPFEDPRLRTAEPYGHVRGR